MENNSEVKTVLFQCCVQFIEQRLKNVQTNILEVEAALTSETKSTAGDKHETGRAMLQLEREKFGVQLSEINKVNQALNKVNIDKPSKTVCLGSVVITDSANYFIAISAGECKVGTATCFAIAPNTPIGLLLMGKKQGDSCEFRGRKIKIKDVF